MKDRPKLTLSRANMILIFLCLVVLVVLLVLNTINNGISKNYLSSVHALSEEDSNLVLLRNTYEEIVVAENHYRSYLASFDTTQRAVFESNMNHVIANLEVISKNNSTYADNLTTEVNSKLRIAATISRLKTIADSLLVQARSGTELLRREQPLLVGRIASSVIQKSFIHSVDTIKEVAVTEKKGFFKRLFSGNKGSNKTTVQYNKGQQIATDSLSTTTEQAADDNYNDLATSIEKYYQSIVNKQMALRKKLDENEKILAAANLSIINEINKGIKQLLVDAELTQQQNKAGAATYLRQAQLHKDRVLLGSFLIIVLIVLVLMTSVYRLSKYEKDILIAKSKAEKLAQVKTRFLNNMSHEIRSPLTAIMGFAEQLGKKGTEQETTRYIAAIRGSSDHLLNTVNDILDFSKLEAGKFRLLKEPFSLKKTLEEVVYNLSVLAEKKNLLLTLQAGFSEQLILEGDAFRLKQILYNFISNAIKFTEQGSIAVTATVKMKNKTEAEVLIAVKDTGIGIAADQLEFIFEEFAQVDSRKISGKYYTRGTGLGLPICKMLAATQSGTVHVQSEINKGSVFSVKIPYTVSSKLVTGSETTKNDVQANTSLQGKKVLLVEDSDMIVMLVTFLLAKYNMQYDVAGDGKQALELFTKNQYDVVLTDIHVPEITGNELAAIIRRMNDPQRAGVPVIALTADVMTEDVRRYYEAGITGILKKPFKENDVTEVLLEAFTQNTVNKLAG